MLNAVLEPSRTICAGYRCSSGENIFSGQKNLYLKQQKEMIEGRIIDLKIQIEFILMLQKYGIPKVPMESEGVTYLEKIKEIKEEMKKVILKRKK